MIQLFPKEIMDSTVEVHLFKNRVRTQVIYTILLVSIVAIIAALPFVYLDIYSISPGVLKAEKERHQIVSPYNGRVAQFALKENRIVNKGDTLFRVDNNIANEKLNLTQEKKAETLQDIHDLNYLLNTRKIRLDSLQRYKYQKDYLQYRQKLSELQTRYKKIKRDFVRQEKLYKKDVIPRVEYQESKYNLDLIINEIGYFKKQKSDRWQTELTEQNTYLKELESSIKQLEKELEQHIVTAPINGTVQNLKGITSGSHIIAGTPVCEISPNTDLIAECYVSPTDIGLLRKGNKVKFQITSYDFNQWGMATGVVQEIGKDILLVNDTPVFKILCSIDQKELYLKNGVSGTLKKGMTLQARFFIANRSVYELLYDKIDDWFHPASQK